MLRIDRYGWLLFLALLLQAATASAQATEDQELSGSDASQPTPLSGEREALTEEESVREENQPGNGAPDAYGTRDVNQEQGTRRKGAVGVPKHVALRMRALSNHLEALSAKGNTAVYGGLFSLALGGASIALGALIDDPSLPTYLYLFGSMHAVRGITGMILVPDPGEPALRFAQMPMASVSDIKRRLRFGGISLKRLADRHRWARLVDGTLLVATGLLAAPLLLMRDDFRFDTALDYFVVAGAGLSLLVGTATLLIPTEAEKRFASYRDFRNRIRRRVEKSRRGSRDAPRLRASLCPTRGGAALFVRAEF